MELKVGAQYRLPDGTTLFFVLEKRGGWKVFMDASGKSQTIRVKRDLLELVDECTDKDEDDHPNDEHDDDEYGGEHDWQHDEYGDDEEDYSSAESDHNDYDDDGGDDNEEDDDDDNEEDNGEEDDDGAESDEEGGHDSEDNDDEDEDGEESDEDNDQDSQEWIVLLSFNLRQWPEKPNGQRLERVVTMLADRVGEKPAIICLQEVLKKEGLEAIRCELGKDDWHMHFCKKTGNNQEGAGFLWRAPIEIDKIEYYSTTDAVSPFRRKPVEACFRYGNFRLEVVNLHLAAGAEARREVPLVASKGLLQSRRGIPRIPLGDLNLRADRAEFDAWRRAGMTSLLPGTENTNLLGTDQYDNIWVPLAFKSYFHPASVVPAPAEATSRNFSDHLAVDTKMTIPRSRRTRASII